MLRGRISPDFAMLPQGEAGVLHIDPSQEQTSTNSSNPVRLFGISILASGQMRSFPLFPSGMCPWVLSSTYIPRSRHVGAPPEFFGDRPRLPSDSARAIHSSRPIYSPCRTATRSHPELCRREKVPRGPPADRCAGRRLTESLHARGAPAGGNDAIGSYQRAHPADLHGPRAPTQKKRILLFRWGIGGSLAGGL